jgi:Putative Actinobacterial Holin-X, holin superfamily III
VLLATAILGIAVALPAWLAALIVGVALLVITAILVGVGVAQVKRSVPPAPKETIKSVKKDVMAIKGIGKRGTT